MKVSRANLHPVRLPLRAPIATAHGQIAARSGVVLSLETPAGERGWGEALPLHGFGLESASEACDALASACARLVGREHADVTAALVAAEPALAAAPAAHAALETALLDLAARASGEPLAAKLAAGEGRAAAATVPTGALLVGEAPDAVAAAAGAALAAGFRTLKLKLGGRPFERDRARVAAARAAAPTAALRLDANAAWGEDEARRHIEALAAFSPELIEQPVAAEDLAAMARLRERAPFPIAADEAVRDLASAGRVLRAGAADVLVLKPAAIGGARAALAIAASAREAGVAVFVTSFLDGAIGRTAALQLAASLPTGTHAAGLATGDAIADDLGDAPAPSAGALRVPAGAGLGVAPEPAALARLASDPAREILA